MAETTQKETLGFQAQVKQLLHLVTHALYSNKEIFLRELISNASDAEDKLRFEAISNSSLYENDTDLQIKIDVDKEKKTITISDNGIGMTRQEVIDNLGTIAKSGTREFLESLSGEKAKDTRLIGQFGVGFYSAFIVADKVTVETRKAGTNTAEGVHWVSDGGGEFTIEAMEKAERGTKIILHLKDDQDEFLEPWRLRNIITKYSDHISFPVVMPKERVEKEDKENEKEQDEVIIEEYEKVNSATALWTLPKSEIKDEEYKEFYKHISHDFEDPLLWGHKRVEGNTEYISLLYIPAHAPFDLWNRDTPRGLKLYIQRVFIMDNAEQLLPLYLRFVKGVIDSNDLPLNVSRELLQNNKIIESIKSATTKHVLTMLEKLAEDDKEQYAKFWQHFGNVLKEGPGEDFANRELIAKLLRFSTTKGDGSKQEISLDDYIARMQPGQQKIYYIAAESYAAANNSPHLEIFKKKDVEVILLFDRVDEWLVSHLTEYDGKQFQSVAKGDLDLGELEDKNEKEEHKKREDEFGDYIKHVKESLGDRVKDVRLTYRLTNSPSCVVSEQFEMSRHIQEMLKQAGQEVPTTKPILELNPDHPIVEKHRNAGEGELFKSWSHLLLDQAILAEGGHLDDPASFVKRMNEMLIEMA